jgi:hypothetical protein
MPSNPRSKLIVGLASATSLVMLMQLLAGKAARDALFLSNFDADVLPYAIVAAGMTSLLSAVPAARLFARFGPARVVPWLFFLSAGLFTLEWLSVQSWPRAVAGLLYLHLAAASAVLISGFWSTVNERFDPHSAKRGIARVSSFATLGGLLGGLISERTSVLFGLDATLLVMAAMHAVCAALILAMGHPDESVQRADPDEGPDESGFSILRRTPYLRLMVAAGFLMALTDALIDWAMKAQAAAAFVTGEELIRFFGIFYTVVGLCTFVVQSLFATRLLTRFGIGPTMSAMPVAVALTSGFALFVPRMVSVVAMRAVGSVLTNSVFRTGFELLYSPLPVRIKRPTKTYVDVGGQRVGDVLGGGFILLILALMPGRALSGVLLSIVVGTGLLALVLRRLQVAYREQLAANLQSGEISLDGLDSLARNVAATQIELDRSEILARIHERRARSERVEPHDRAEAGDVSDLIEALGDPQRAAGAAARLRAASGSISGALIEALNDPDRPAFEKLLLPGILAQYETEEVMDGLLAALGQPDLEVRFRCGRAAARIALRQPGLRPDHERVLRALRDEIASDPPEAAARRLPPGEDRAESTLLGAQPDLVVARRVEHIFTVLALHHEEELMRSVLLGLHSSDLGTRGTALEYIEVSLPEDLRRAILTLVGIAEGGPTRRGRAARQLEIELRRAAQASIVVGGTARPRGGPQTS